MIKYKLICKECDLTFDSWFASSKEYEKLKKKNFLNCHNCNSEKIEKSLMAPRLLNSSKENSLTNSDLNFKKISVKIKEYQKFIKNNFKYVGQNFAYEARSIHYGKKKKKKQFMVQPQNRKLMNLRRKGLKLKLFLG